MNTFFDSRTSFSLRMPRPVREHEILRVVGNIQGDDAKQTAKSARKEVLLWTKNRSGGSLPKEAWEYKGFEYFFGGRNVVGVRIKESQIDIWSIRADEPDDTVAKRIWTTEIVIATINGQHPVFTVRSLVSTPEDELRIEPHVPGVVRQLSDKIGLYRNGYKFQSFPVIVDSQEKYDWLVYALLDPARTVPIFVFTLPKDIEVVQSNNTKSLCNAVLGIGVVVVCYPDYCWELTRHLGQQRSVFSGAARTYMPGFSDDSNPYDHRLFLASQLSTPEGNRQCFQWMRILAAKDSIRRTRLGNELLTFSSIRNASLQFSQKSLEKSGASDHDKLLTAYNRIKALEERVARIESENEYYVDEHNKEYLRAQDAERLYNLSAFRIQQLLDQIKGAGVKPDSNIPFPAGWDKFGDWCDQYLAGRLVLASSARRAVQSPEYEDIQLAVRCLFWLANECRESLLGQSNLQLREAIIESGVRNSPCGGDEYEVSWNGQKYVVGWHVKNGGNTRDPARCLRIYWFWEPSSQQIIIVDMPAHKRTGAS
ncbi:MAG: hypothetical protein HQL90_10400 [Magnetococcales bacterium]|nr:hypothetical protein [Magnetococcales bacterium]